MRVVFDPERDPLTVFRKERLLACGQPQHRPQPPLPAAHHIENALAHAKGAGPRGKRKVLLQFRLQPEEASAQGLAVDRGIHGGS
jgi:hypothetical protein